MDNEGRNLVLCFDGTHNQFQSLPFTNVLKLFRLLEKNSDRQMCYYQPGVGVALTAEFGRLTDNGYLNQTYTSMLENIDVLVAYSLDAHIIDAYTWLMKYFRDGDRIYMFGFSRGAFTARVLAGMIERVGLLHRGLETMVSTAWKIHKRWEDDGQPDLNYGSDEVAIEFKNTFSRPNLEIHFMGLWDSINSVGLVRDRLFPYTSWSDTVKHVRHAVSMDERRGKFKQNLFVPITYTQPIYPLASVQKPRCPRKRTKTFFEWLFNCDQAEYESRADLVEDHVSEDLLELWFPGCHGDIGGAWPDDFNGQNLANIPLRWMIAAAVEFGVMFKKGSVHEFSRKYPPLESLLSCHHDPLWTFRNRPMNHPEPDPWMKSHGDRGEAAPRRDPSELFPDTRLLDGPPEQPVACFDSRGDDSFLRSVFWWALEILPIGVFIENENQKWRRVYVPNFGRSRLIPTDARAHWSFFWRWHYVSDYKVSSSLPDDLRLKYLEMQQNTDWAKVPDDLEKWLNRYPNL